MAERAVPAPNLEVPIDTSTRTCAGCAAAYVFRSLATRAGSYSPNTSQRMFYYLTGDSAGRDIPHVAGYFFRYRDELNARGFRVIVRQVAFQTDWILDWVQRGNGFRGAVLATVRSELFPDKATKRQDQSKHAVALTLTERGRIRRKPSLTLTDPWPRSGFHDDPPETLTAAHEKRKYASLVMHWSGWS